MSKLRESLVSLVAHQLGIVPLSYDSEDINRILSALPPEEARAMRRKFRKMWRKEAHAYPTNTKSARRFATRYKEQMGFGASDPTKDHKLYRKHAVARRLNIVANSMLDKIS